MVTKMTDLAIKEMDSFYAAGITMMDYFEKQLHTIGGLNPWLKDTSRAGDVGQELFKPFMTAMGMVSAAEYQRIEKESSALAERLKTAMDDIDSYKKGIDVHQKTIADQAEYIDSLKKLNEGIKVQLAELKKELAENKTLIADREKKIAEGAKELIDSRKSASSQEKDLKKYKKQTEQMEKEIAELKTQIDTLRKQGN